MMVTFRRGPGSFAVHLLEQEEGQAAVLRAPKYDQSGCAVA